MLSKEEKEKIVQKLQERGAILPCPRCSNSNFVISDAYFVSTLQEDIHNISLGGPGIPTISVICARCGYVSQHALGVLGLLEEKKAEVKENAK